MYNCGCLKRLELYSTTLDWGTGVFTGCVNVKELVIHADESVRSCLKEILAELKHTLTVTYDGAGKAVLIFPEFFEEAVENTPARIISTQTHGMGIQYRNAFRNTQVNLKEYDKLFDMGKYNIDSIDLAELAVARLRCPYELGEAERAAYAGWLSENLETGAAYCLKREYPEDLRWLAETFVTEEGQMELLLREAERQDAPEIVSMLMDARHRRFPAKKKKFSL